MKNRPLRSVGWLVLLVLIIPWGVQSMGASGGDAQILMLSAYLGIPALILLSRLVEWLISGGWRRKTEPQPEFPSSDGEELEAVAGQLDRRERESYRWACIFLLLGVGAYLSTFVLVWFTRRGITGTTRERHQKLEELDRNLNFVGILVLLCLLAFLISFVKWFLAMRRRRKALEADSPLKGR